MTLVSFEIYASTKVDQPVYNNFSKNHNPVIERLYGVRDNEVFLSVNTIPY